MREIIHLAIRPRPWPLQEAAGYYNHAPKSRHQDSFSASPALGSSWSIDTNLRPEKQKQNDRYRRRRRLPDHLRNQIAE